MWSSTSTHGLTATETVVDYLRNDLFEPIIQMQAIKRRQEAEDLADVLLFFVTDEGVFVTGRTIAVDGGLTRP